MKGKYTKSTFALKTPSAGKDTGPETMTEQEYIPIAVQVKRMINAGEQLLVAKKEMYDLGWDEEFNLNNVHPHAINMNMDRVDMQEVMENATEKIKTAKSTGKPTPSPKEPESTGSTDIPSETSAEETSADSSDTK
jgi:ribosomal protein L12E/L44/L45/RPP1/RPP2